MKQRHLWAIAGIMLTLAACGRTETPDQAGLTSDHRTDDRAGDNTKISAQFSGVITRQTLTTMTFTKWGDVLMVDAGVAKSTDGKCSFSEPIKQDASTRWTPFQIYWTIFDNASDVRNGTTIAGIFSDDDVADATTLSKADGTKPKGFAYLSEQSAGYVNLSTPERLSDGAELRTVLSISGHKAAIRAIVEAKDGACVTKTEACRGGTECFNGGAFQPLGNIHVLQNPFGMPREIQQQPELSVQKD
jgi:hypothetical protein